MNRNYTHSAVRVLALVGALSAMTGCMTQEQKDAQQAVLSYRAGDYATAKKLLEPISKNTNEDFVLNNVRLGSSTLAMFDLSASEAAFLRAYEVLNSLGVNNGGRTVGAVLVDEKIKIWQGEPFERAMANFYLGLVYYMEADYNNARGAFENALFKLRDYVDSDDEAAASDGDKKVKTDKYRDIESNFALGQYMLARCYQRLGQEDLARANFQKLIENNPRLSAMADYDLNGKSNLLLVIDYGMGPHKETDLDGALVGFAPTPAQIGPPPRVNVLLDESEVDTSASGVPLVDLVALAQDRKWQSIDTIRTIKSVLGTGLIAAGAYELGGNHKSDTEAGLALVAAGLLLKATSQADVRIWEMLPRSTYAVAITATAGTHDVTIQFPDTGLRQTLHGLIVPATGESTYYFRVHGGSVQQTTWPPPTLTAWPIAPALTDNTVH